jgi:hypothetical protein
MTVPFNHRVAARREPEVVRSEGPRTGDRTGDSLDERRAANVGEAAPPRLHVPPWNHRDPFEEAVHRRQAAPTEAGFQARHEWSRSEDLNSVEQLAAMLEARQCERAQRYNMESPADPPEDGPFCWLGGSLPAPNEMRALVLSYNQVIAELARRRGATLVDLFSRQTSLCEESSSLGGFPEMNPVPTGILDYGILDVQPVHLTLGRQHSLDTC